MLPLLEEYYNELFVLSLITLFVYSFIYLFAHSFTFISSPADDYCINISQTN